MGINLEVWTTLWFIWFSCWKCMAMSLTVSKSCVCQTPSYRAGKASNTLYPERLKSDGMSGYFGRRVPAKQMIRAKEALILFQEILSWKGELYQAWQCWERKVKGCTGLWQQQRHSRPQAEQMCNINILKNYHDILVASPLLWMHPAQMLQISWEDPI